MNLKNYKAKIIFFITILIFTNNHAFSQSIIELEKNIPDSIRLKIEGENTKEKVLTLISESKKFINISNDINLQISKLAKLYAEKQKNKEIIGLSFKSLGVSYFLLEKYDSALVYYNKSLKLLKKTSNTQEISNVLYNLGYTYSKMGFYQKGIIMYNQSIEKEKPLKNLNSIAYSYNCIGMNYYYLGKYDEAIKYYLMALEITPKTKLTQIGRTYNNLGVLYKTRGNYKKALSFYNKSRQIFTESGNEFHLSEALNNIGSIYEESFHQYDKAIKFYKKSLELKRKIGNRNSIGITLNNIAGISARINNYNDALVKYKEAINIFKEINSNEGLVLTYNNLGNLYLLMKKYNLSKKNYIESLRISKKLNYREYISENYKSLSNLYYLTEMPKKAYENFVKYDSIKDSIFNETSNKKIAELTARYQTKEKIEKLKLLEIENTKQKETIKRNKLYFFITVAFSALILIFLYLLSALKRLNTIHKNSELKQKLFRLQMNPHFIFNSLIAIQSYIYQNNTNLAGEYLSKYSKLIRLILNYSNNNYCLLEKEIELTKYYIDLQLLRYNNNFDYSIDIDKNVNPENIKVPPMLIQPFVENSIEHGIKNLSNRRGKINIKISLNNKKLFYAIEDNGVGFEIAKNIEASLKTSDYEKHSLAVSITKDRLSLLGKKKYNKSRLEIIQKENENEKIDGVLINIHVPYVI